jgi:RimJ/RimL family protein N-acetyltransferase
MSGLSARVKLGVLAPEHYEEIFSWLGQDNVGALWRFNQGLPTREQFVVELWRGMNEQAVVFFGDDPTPVGLVSSYGVNRRNQICFVAVMSSPKMMRSGLAIGGLALFMDRLFTTWPLRKIYADVADYNLHSYRGVLSHIAEVEATLRDYLWWDGGLHDRMTIKFERERWMADAHPFLHPESPAGLLGNE